MFKIGDRVIAKEKVLVIAQYALMHGMKELPKGYIDIIRDLRPSEARKGCQALMFESTINPISPNTGKEFAYVSSDFEKLVSDSELNEYRETVSIPELQTIKPFQPQPQEVEQF